MNSETFQFGYEVFDSISELTNEDAQLLEEEPDFDNALPKIEILPLIPAKIFFKSCYPILKGLNIECQMSKSIEESLIFVYWL